MKVNKFGQVLYMAALGGCLTMMFPETAKAALGGPSYATESYVAMIQTGNPAIYVSMDSYDILKEAQPGEAYPILGDEGNGWVEIQVGEDVGYLSVKEGVSVRDKKEEQNTEEEAQETQEVLEEPEQQTVDNRRALVDYALQFLGCRYRSAGSDPSGFDCSGFVRYVMQNGAGVSLNRSSGAQAGQGVSVSSEQMRPGDLIFYAKGGRINHVAMYIGEGKVIHASTYKTGVKLSPWNYRAPAKIVNVLGE